MSPAVGPITRVNQCDISPTVTMSDPQEMQSGGSGANDGDEGTANLPKIQEGVDFVQQFLPDEAKNPKLDRNIHSTVETVAFWLDYFKDGWVDTDG